MKNILFILILLFIGGQTTWAQEEQPEQPSVEEVGEEVLSGNSKKVKADKSYGNLGYMKSVEMYQGVQDKTQKSTVSMMSNMANAYRLNGDTQSAEYWYERYINKAENTDDLLHYAQVLQSNGKCEDAVRWYTKYRDAKGEVKRDFLGDCDELEDFIDRKNIEVLNATTLNSEQLDFSPIPHKEGLVFTSNRDKKAKTCCRDSWTNKDFSDLYFSDIADNSEGGKSFSTPRLLSSKINKKTHDGTATFSVDNQKMIFTRNNQKGPAENDVVKLQLYAAKADGPGWTEIQSMSLNNSEWASAHPSLSESGDRLYFASDRPDGYGGMDIWVSKNENGKWAEPTNLGAEVNSAGNELFPYVGKNSMLYFSSDGHKGLGGLDLFSIKQTTEGDENSWSRRRNMGKPLNSTMDDFAYTMDKSGETGYFTSNRSGGIGGDDIYLWNKTGPDEEQVFLTILDAETGEVLESVEVTLVRQPSTEENYTTDEKGTVKLLVKLDEKFDVKVSKSGYLDNSISISAVDLYEQGTYSMNLERPTTTKFEGVILAEKGNTPIANATVKLLEKCTGKTLEATSDENGVFSFDVKGGCDYELMSTKENFKTKDVAFTISKEDCYSQIPIKREIKLAAAKEEIVIRLNDIYYNFDRSAIRTDAIEQLVEVVSIMQKYPSLEIALRSHTDSRGSDTYNDKLSQKRAKEAKEYIVSQGIDAARISTAQGFGEKELTNDCKNGVRCGEEKHQANRRTQIQITKFDEPNVILRK